MKRFILTVLTTFFVLCSANFDLRAQAKKTVETHGLLYKISGKNLKKPSYIFGTIHIVCPNDMFSMEKLGGYLDQTDQLLMELDMDNAAEIQVMGGGLVIPDGKTLKDFLTAEQFSKVDEMFKNHVGFSVENVKQVKPFVLAIMVSSNPKALGCNPASYESSFVQAALAKKKGVEGLETAASQFAVMDKTPLEKQAKDLYEMSLNPQKSIDGFKKLSETYKMQDSEALYDYMNTQMSGVKDFQTNLLDNRNTDWIPKLEKAMGEKPTFIAVGGGHLGGKKGLLSLLKAKGYKVEAIKL